MIEKLFKLKENKTDVKTEVIGGITTFMTMAYILAVNPSLLSAAGMDPTAVLIASCLAAFVGTICMALLANYPFALAPGMGLNAYFAFTVCGSMGYSWQVALLAGNPRWARVVGYALHVNPEPGTIPCHRVVNREGRVAPGFAFGGEGVQRQLLESEGIVFESDGRIDLGKYSI